MKRFILSFTLLFLSIGIAFAQPSNDLPCNATDVGLLVAGTPTIISGTNVNATTTTEFSTKANVAHGYSANFHLSDVWYKFKLPSGYKSAKIILTTSSGKKFTMIQRDHFTCSDYNDIKNSVLPTGGDYLSTDVFSATANQTLTSVRTSSNCIYINGDNSAFNPVTDEVYLAVGGTTAAQQGAFSLSFEPYGLPTGGCPLACPANIGSFVTEYNGAVVPTTTSYDLSSGETFNITSNNDFVLPTASSTDAAGVGYAAFSCDPSSYLLDDPTKYNTTDMPCFKGFQFSATFHDENSGNASTSTGKSFGVTAFWMVPLTFDDICSPLKPTADCKSGNTDIGIDINNDGCMSRGAPIKINYLQPVACQDYEIQMYSDDQLNTTTSTTTFSCTAAKVYLGPKTFPNTPDFTSGLPYPAVKVEITATTGDLTSAVLNRYSSTSVFAESLDAYDAGGASVVNVFFIRPTGAIFSLDKTDNSSGVYTYKITDLMSGAVLATGTWTITAGAESAKTGVIQQTGTCSYSGPGVTNGFDPSGTNDYSDDRGIGVFDPVAAGAGNHAITYSWDNGLTGPNHCSITKTMNVTVACPPIACQDYEIQMYSDDQLSTTTSKTTFSCADAKVYLGPKTFPQTADFTSGLPYPAVKVEITATSGDLSNAVLNRYSATSVFAESLDAYDASGSSAVNVFFIRPTGAIFSLAKTDVSSGVYTYKITDIMSGTVLATGTWTITGGAESAKTVLIQQTGTCSYSGPGVTNGFDPSGTNDYSDDRGIGVFDPAVAGAGTHSITYTWDNGLAAPNHCAVTKTMSITVTTPPVPTPMANFSTCPSSTLSLTATGGSNLKWYSDASKTTQIGTGSPCSPAPTSDATPSVKLYYVTNTIGACVSDVASVEVTVISVPTANAGTNGTINCALNTSGIQIGQTSESNVSYAWSPSSGLSNATASNPTANPSSSTTYTLVATSTLGTCFATSSVAITVNKNIPTANAGANATISCSQNINGASIGGAADLAYHYAWSPVTDLSGFDISSPTANPATNTLYTLTVTDTLSKCTQIGSVQVSVNKTPPPVTLTPSATTTPCGSPINITASVSTSLLGNWTSIPDEGVITKLGATMTATPIAPITYIYSVGSGQCTSTGSVLINVTRSLTSTFAFSKDTICAGENTLLSYTGNATPAANYFWNFNSGNATPGAGVGPHTMTWFTPAVQFVTLYVLENGCYSDTTTVPVFNKLCMVKVPNVFTPNEDGHNDNFYIVNLEYFPNTHCLIFNRWGNKVYESSNYQNDWDAKNVAAGTYYYVIEFANGRLEAMTGTVTIIREGK